MLAEAEAETGLTLPEDLQTLLGDGLSVAVDSSADLGAMASGSGDVDPADLPVGVRIVGDPDEITGVLDKVEAALGPVLGPIVVEEGDGVVALGLDEDYVATLAEDGSLGEEDRFGAALERPRRQRRRVVRRLRRRRLADRAGGDATPTSEELQANLEPLTVSGSPGAPRTASRTARAADHRLSRTVTGLSSGSSLTWRPRSRATTGSPAMACSSRRMSRRSRPSRSTVLGDSSSCCRSGRVSEQVAAST